MNYQDLVHGAVEASAHIDLSDVSYGYLQTTEGGVLKDVFCRDPVDYYFFLAGLVRTARASTIIEIGTHVGGSARAMARGFAEGIDGLVVTVDVTQESDPFLEKEARIRKILGRAESDAAREELTRLLGRRSVDLLFLDGTHVYEATLDQFETYVRQFAPKMVIIDDINLTDDMRRLWQELVAKYGKRALDLTQVSARVRDPACGFGLVDLRPLAAT